MNILGMKVNFSVTIAILRAYINQFGNKRSFSVVHIALFRHYHRNLVSPSLLSCIIKLILENEAHELNRAVSKATLLAVKR